MRPQPRHFSLPGWLTRRIGPPTGRGIHPPGHCADLVTVSGAGPGPFTTTISDRASSPGSAPISPSMEQGIPEIESENRFPKLRRSEGWEVHRT